MGGAGELGVDIKAVPGRAALDLTYKGDRSYVGGKFAVAGKDWTGGLTGGVRLGKATLEGSFMTNLNTWEVQASIRIPLGRS